MDKGLAKLSRARDTAGMKALSMTPSTRVLVLTGAGASAESGIPTFRDANGLWESHRFEDVASPHGFRRDPKLVWRFYSERRRGVLSAQPNEGHMAIARLEAELGDRFLLVTQNVDGLHGRAGSQRMIEMHGNLLKTRCSHCQLGPFDDTELYLDTPPDCSACASKGLQSLLRPHIVWFGEALDPDHMSRMHSFMAEAGSQLCFIAVGTSGHVFPAAQLVDAARAVGGRTILVNRDEADNAERFEQVIRGQSGEILPTLLG